MADRLTELVLGLQRMAENAKLRGEDLLYTQELETYEHREWLNQQFAIVEKVRMVLLEELKKFTPAGARVHQLSEKQDKEAVPKFLKQGPAA